jgi:hypothetical protein
MDWQTSRRSVLSLAGVTVTVGTAGCGMFSSSDIDVHVTNGVDQEYDYRVSVDEFETEGTLESRATDTYEEEIDRPSLEGEMTVDARFGLAVGGEEDGADGENGSTDGEATSVEVAGGSETLDISSEMG